MYDHEIPRLGCLNVETTKLVAARVAGNDRHTPHELADIIGFYNPYRDCAEELAVVARLMMAGWIEADNLSCAFKTTPLVYRIAEAKTPTPSDTAAVPNQEDPWRYWDTRYAYAAPLRPDSLYGQEGQNPWLGGRFNLDFSK